MPIGNLKSFGGSYTQIVAGDSVTLGFTGEDIAVYFTTSSVCQIKVKIDGTYLTKLQWHTGEIEVISPFSYAFDLAYTPAHSYYDTVDTATSENPSVIRLVDPLSYGSHTIVIEVTNVANNVFNLEAFAIYKNSTRANVRTIDSTMVGAPLTVESNAGERRNDVVVVGAEQGLFQQDGVTVNPNNPIAVRTYSRAIDLSSMYDHSSNQYVGRRIPFEIYNDRILNQERANHIALSALKRYRKKYSVPRFIIPGDPRIGPGDVLEFVERKLNTLPEGSRVWVESIEETFENGNYFMEIICTPREPIASFEYKREPDLGNFNNEPIINIQLKSRGKRIAGNDASIAGDIVIIATSPGWDADMWNGYYFYDAAGVGFKILDTTSQTVQIELNENTFTDGNWSISFDPFDTDQKGAPLEIHYDQVINARVQIWIKDAADNAIARLNKDMWDLLQEWGADKAVYWSGVVEFNVMKGKAGCYISPFSAEYTKPLHVEFVVLPENTIYDNVSIKTNAGGSDLHNGYIQMGGVTVQRSSLGAIRIYPKLLYDLPLVRVKTGSRNHAADIKYWGYVSAFSLNDPSPPKATLTLSPNPNFSTDQYQNYLLADCRNRKVYLILSNTSNQVVIDSGSSWYADMGAVNNLVFIIGQSGVSGKQSLFYDHFKSSDNDYQGLKLIAEVYNTQFDESGGQSIQSMYYRNGANDKLNISVNGVNYTEGASDLVGTPQQYPDREIYIKEYLDYKSYSLSDRWPMIPNNTVLTNPDFRIIGLLDIYTIPTDANNLVLKKLNAQPMTIIDTNGFVQLREWSYYLQPKNMEVTGDAKAEKIVLQNGDGRAWIFLFKFIFMDRAGRIVLNKVERGKIEDWHGDERYFHYMVGWMPESGSPREFFTVENCPPDIKQAGIFDQITYW